MQAARSAISLSVFLSVSNWEMAQFRAILRAHRGIASIIPHLFRQNNISPPEGYQAERLVEMLEDRHGRDQFTLAQEGREQKLKGPFSFLSYSSLASCLLVNANLGFLPLYALSCKEGGVTSPAAISPGSH